MILAGINVLLSLAVVVALGMIIWNFKSPRKG